MHTQTGGCAEKRKSVPSAILRMGALLLFEHSLLTPLQQKWLAIKLKCHLHVMKKLFPSLSPIFSVPASSWSSFGVLILFCLLSKHHITQM